VHLETPKPLEAIHCKRILCALDCSDRAGDVLRYAWWLSQQFDAQLAVVHATPPLNGAYYGYGIEEEYAEAMVAQARKRIDELQDATASHIDQVYITAGAPWKIVSCAARQFDAELLVMGRHSAAGVAGFLRPNAYSILREVPCPAISI
jgi:nucleotide-binding universal stress UspA family protein